MKWYSVWVCRSFYPVIGFIILCFFSCKNNRECPQDTDKKYADEQVDPALLIQAVDYRDTLLKRFDDTLINGQQHDIYRLLYYSSHGFGKSVKFEKKDMLYLLSVKCLSKNDWLPACKSYQVAVTKEEWDNLERMICEFNFWTEARLATSERVLDGFVYLLEGNRSGQRLDSKAYQLIGRGSPRYDKIGALCQYIIEYEEELAARYSKK